MKLTIKTEIRIELEPVPGAMYLARARDVNHPEEEAFESLNRDPSTAMTLAAQELIQYIVEAHLTA